MTLANGKTVTKVRIRPFAMILTCVGCSSNFDKLVKKNSPSATAPPGSWPGSKGKLNNKSVVLWVYRPEAGVHRSRTCERARYVLEKVSN